MKTPVNNQLAEVRKGRGIGQSSLAAKVGVSRQTIHAIETGEYVPNTEVALRLAQELEVTVDQLFSLPGPVGKPLKTMTVESISEGPLEAGRAVRICKVSGRWVGVPVTASPYYFPEADGIVERSRRTRGRAEVAVFAGDEVSEKRLAMAGCDPASSLLTGMVEKISGVEIVCAAASSRRALAWLKDGRVHIAGSHLEDSKTGEFNLPFVRREFPDGDFSVITFARWEAGLVVAAGNPKRIRAVEDLAHKRVRIVNREPGSGSRALLDKLLHRAGIDSKKVAGYERIAQGHLAAAYAVASGTADGCMATRSAARAFGLDFLPLHSERYDLILRRSTLELPAAKAFLDVLQRSVLRRKLETLAGYDTAQTGAVLV
jgi:molybdate-binding protein/DNA-binding XRE family transcriptional regulator